MATQRKTTGWPILGHRYRMPPPYGVFAAYTVTVDAIDRRRGIIFMQDEQGHPICCTRATWRCHPPTPVDDCASRPRVHSRGRFRRSRPGCHESAR